MSVIKDIADQTKVINDIAFQTKLLSFNASVEAARAGEHGKGFSVVAQEIGSLASLSGNSARSIEENLAQGLQKIEEVVRSSAERALSAIESLQKRGTTLQSSIQKCLQIFQNIESQVGSASERFDGVLSASNEQALGISEVKKSLIVLNSLAGNQKTTAEKTAHITQELKQQTEEIKTLSDEMHRAA